MSQAVHVEGKGGRVSVPQLRELLSVRFPGSAGAFASSGKSSCVPSQAGGGGALRGVVQTGFCEWDAVCGGLRLGEVTEVCGALGGAGLVMDGLLEAGAGSGWFGAWVDAGDSLEVGEWQPGWLKRMLWVRCSKALTALKAADLLLRDGNLSWVVLDLQGMPAAVLRRVSSQHWHRFHRLVKQFGNALLVLTPAPMVEGARVRVAVGGHVSLDALARPRAHLREGLRVQVFVRGRGHAGSGQDEAGSVLALQKTA